MKIFIIDDDRISLFLTEQILKLEGFTENITAFSSANEGVTALLELLPDHFPEIILLDLEMPAMNGWDVLEALAPYSTQIRGKCRIYILTSSLAQSDAMKSKEYPLVSGLLHKPFDQEGIRAIFSHIKKEESYTR